MTGYIDTNALIRHFTGDPPDAERPDRIPRALELYEQRRVDYTDAYPRRLRGARLQPPRRKLRS